MDILIATWLGAIAGGLTGGLIMYVVLNKAFGRQQSPGTIKARILAYAGAGIMLGLPGGLLAEVLMSAIDR